MSLSNPPHYSPYQIAGNLLLTSGQLPINEDGTVADSIEDQTRLVLEKVECLLAKEGMNRGHILKTTAFITDINDWNVVNNVYREFFQEHKPARSVIPCSELHFGCKIELEAIAIKN